MTIGQQLVMMLTLMLTSKGVAGVPRAALVVLTATLTQFDLPLEGAAILLGIDQIMDMGRTAVNVMGNCIATAVVARWEGVFDDEQMRAFEAALPGRPDADRGRRRARPARRRDRARVRGRPRGRRRSTRADLDVTDDAAVDGGDGRVRARTSIVNCAGVQRRRRRRGSSGRRAERQRVRRARARRARPSATARRSSTTAPTSCSTARRRRRTPRRIGRIRGACTPRRSCSASGLRPMRRARTCCASRACSAARPAGGPAKGSVAGILKTLLAGGDAAGVRGPHGVADLRHRRGARDAAAARDGRAGRALSLRQLAAHCTWLEFARELARQLGRRAAARRRCGWPT